MVIISMVVNKHYGSCTIIGSLICLPSILIIVRVAYPSVIQNGACINKITPISNTLPESYIPNVLIKYATVLYPIKCLQLKFLNVKLAWLI